MNKEMNDIMRIIEALKQECQKIRKSKDHISIEEVAETMEISVHTLKNGMDCAVTPYKSIIEFCYNEKINYRDIYFREAKVMCVDCGTEITDQNKIEYQTKRKDENGNFIRANRRQCHKCYTDYRNEKNKERIRLESKYECCLYCEKSFSEVERAVTEYKTKRGSIGRKPKPSCVECEANPEFMKEKKLERKRESYRKNQLKKGIKMRGDEGYVNPRKLPEKTKTVKPKKIQIKNQKSQESQK